MSESDLRVRALRTGHVREGDPNSGADPDFVPNAIAELFRHWITPARPDLSPDEVHQALVIFTTDGVRVAANDQASFTAVAGTNATVCDPTDVFVGQILDIWPEGVDPDLAWTGFTTARGGRVFVCDLRRNRDRVLVLLDRAEEFYRSATLTLSEGLVAPAVEHLHSAAEQAVMTLMLLDGWKGRQHHRPRREWLAREIKFSSVPAAFGEAFEALAADRNLARYAEGPLQLDAATAGAIAEQVRQLITYARDRRG